LDCFSGNTAQIFPENRKKVLPNCKIFGKIAFYFKKNFSSSVPLDKLNASLSDKSAHNFYLKFQNETKLINFCKYENNFQQIIHLHTPNAILAILPNVVLLKILKA